MYLRQSKNYHAILAVSLAASTVIWISSVSAQPLPGPSTIQPGPVNRPENGPQPVPRIPPHLTGEEAESFRKNLAAYDQCTREKAREIRLTDAALNVIQLRDRRQYWESLLLGISKSKYPNANLSPAGGYPQMLASGFAEYKSLGGTAATVDEVQPMTPPCTNPWTAITRPQAPLTDSRKINVAPK